MDFYEIILLALVLVILYLFYLGLYNTFININQYREDILGFPVTLYDNNDENNKLYQQMKDVIDPSLKDYNDQPLKYRRFQRRPLIYGMPWNIPTRYNVFYPIYAGVPSHLYY